LIFFLNDFIEIRENPVFSRFCKIIFSSGYKIRFLTVLNLTIQLCLYRPAVMVQPASRHKRGSNNERKCELSLGRDRFRTGSGCCPDLPVLQQNPDLLCFIFDYFLEKLMEDYCPVLAFSSAKGNIEKFSGVNARWLNYGKQITC
jgi:hypothetical protein